MLKSQNIGSLMTLINQIFLQMTTFLFLTIFFLVFFQVIVRTIASKTGYSFPWTEEIARYLLVVTTYLGSAVAVFYKEHLTIPFIYDKLPSLVKKIIDFIWQSIIFIISLFIIMGCYKMSQSLSNAPVGTLRWLKIGHIYMLLGFSFFLVALNTLYLNYQALKGIFLKN